MDYVETEGETIDQAIENALKILGVGREKVTVDILTEGTKGILGFGAKKARVRASLRTALSADEKGKPSQNRARQPDRLSREDIEAAGQKGKEVLTDILSLMGIQATIEVKQAEMDDEIILDIHGDSSALLIGRKGQTLEALQYLVTRIANDKQGKEGPHLLLDTESYRGRRRKSLEDMALRLGEKAKRQRKAVTMNAPLSAADRRIIHLALQDDPWLKTRSLGTGAYRRLLIIPEGDRKRRDEERGQPPGKQEAKGDDRKLP
jgi:spoIIIJ-associated protein